MKGFRCWSATALAILCATAASAAVSAQVLDAPHAITSQGRIFLRDGQPFFPVLGLAWVCPSQSDPSHPSMTIADDLASIGVNVVEGAAAQCRPNDPQLLTLGAALKDRMWWVEQDTLNPPPHDLPELAQWQPLPLSPRDSSEIDCGRYSSLGLYNKLMALAKKGPVLSWVPIGSSAQHASLLCVTPQKIRNVFMVSLVGQAAALGWMTIDPRNANTNDGFSVPGANLATAKQLVVQLKKLTPVLLSGVRLKVAQPEKSSVRVAAWYYRGVATAIAVNTSSKVTRARIWLRVGKHKRLLSYRLAPLASAITSWKLK